MSVAGDTTSRGQQKSLGRLMVRLTNIRWGLIERLTTLVDQPCAQLVRDLVGELTKGMEALDRRRREMEKQSPTLMDPPVPPPIPYLFPEMAGEELSAAGKKKRG